MQDNIGRLSILMFETTATALNDLMRPILANYKLFIVRQKYFKSVIMTALFSNMKMYSLLVLYAFQHPNQIRLILCVQNE